VRRPKADQEGEGDVAGRPYGLNPATCPVRARRAARAPLPADGPAFRGITRPGKLSVARLTDGTVADMVKTAGLNATTFSGHSLRAGFATEAFRQGVAVVSVMRHGRWKTSPATRRTSARVSCGARTLRRISGSDGVSPLLMTLGPFVPHRGGAMHDCESMGWARYSHARTPVRTWLVRCLFGYSLALGMPQRVGCMPRICAPAREAAGPARPGASSSWGLLSPAEGSVACRYKMS